MGAMIVGLGVAAFGAGCGGGRQVLVVDQIEEGRALLIDEAGEAHGIDVAELPAGAGEGDMLVDWCLDPALAEATRRELAAQRRRLAQEDDGADFSLIEEPR